MRLLSLALPVLLTGSLLLTPLTAATIGDPPAAAALSVGETFTLASKVLGETRRLNVYLPPGYADSATLRLPVLYMPDGGLAEDFLHIAGLVQIGVSNGTMRPFILVGIENTQRRRDLTGPTENADDRKIAPRVGGAAAFRQFIRRELMPEVRRRYRTTAETAIVGESLAGLFVLETLLLEPDLFDTYVAADPSLWWNNEYLVKQSRQLLTALAGKPKMLYVATSSEQDISAATRRLTEAFGAAPSLRWTYDPMPAETHRTIFHPAALRGFRTVLRPAQP